MKKFKLTLDVVYVVSNVMLFTYAISIAIQNV